MNTIVPVEFRRKEIRLHPLRYMGQNTYFLTFCCARRRPIFRDPQTAARLVEQLRERSAVHAFAVHAYRVMPDHLHLIVCGLEPRSDLIVFVSDLKHETAHLHRARTGEQLWQKRFYDRVLRSGERADAVAGYIWMNPVRKGMCSAPQDYPYSGSFVIDWKRGVSSAESWIPEWRKKK
ncbi:MAG TPA: transposase [Candidatus Aquilonibacter sp.]|nr:transposase [Candidatus Aquilonibacter sp.]